MQPIETLEPLKRTACENLHKIRKWVKDNTTDEQRRQLMLMGCCGEFHSNGMVYSWGVSDGKYIIYMGVGASDLGIPFSDMSESKKCLYDVEIDGFVYKGNVQYSSAFVNEWPKIKAKILDCLQTIRTLETFEA